VSLFAVGFVAAALLWLGLVWIPRRLAPADAVRRFAAAQGLAARGDGLARPLTVVGQVRGRYFTVTWQRHPVGGDVLLIGVDCACADAASVSTGTLGAGAVAAADDAALVTRWVRPAADVLEPRRLAVLVDALAKMAEELEIAAPAEGPEVE
jgi:hypothetical protein